MDLIELVGAIDTDDFKSVLTEIFQKDNLYKLDNSLRDREIFSKTVPAKLQSYMALQKPIIAVLKGDGAEIIKDSNSGFVEENYNYNNLAKMIQKISNMSEEELDNLGKNGRSYYDNHFSIEKRKQQLYNLIK